MTDINTQKKRLNIILVFFYLFFILIIGRLIYLQIYKHSFYKLKSHEQLKKIIQLSAHRGAIFDRNNRPLALTTASYSLYAAPYEIEDKDVFAKSLSAVLGKYPWNIQQQLKTSSPFVWLKRKVDPELAESIRKLKLKGLGLIREEKRVYPFNTLASDVLGFVGVDNQGLGGLEYNYNSILEGTPYQIVIEGDPQGFRLITSPRNKGSLFAQPKKDGQQITLTLDERIQYIAQKELKKGVEENEAIAGQAIVMDCRNGDIIAMCDYPDFDPNKWTKQPHEILKNSCVTDVYEPGSTFKIFTLAAVLEEKLASPRSLLRVPKTLTVGGRTIKEAHDNDEIDHLKKKSVTQILQYSLNVGTSLLAQRLGKRKFHDYITDFGFGAQTGLKLPGESAGLVRRIKDWVSVDINMISFGQGIAVTPLQLVTAVSAIANDGTRLKPRIIKHIHNHNGLSLKSEPSVTKGTVVSKKTARDITEMMVTVVENGTGQRVKIPGHRIAGKTGTAQKPKKDGIGYEPKKYIASFVGFFPADNPRFSILVTVDSPKKHIWGGSVAGPVFREIAKRLIDVYGIQPTVF